ncbi:hypothetical protein AB9P05_03865 [Roseivirga sp. BDSF3-8]|uniref:hypothetical protein n=1 Tax=Roseivirga sp. BDSF3-8 TaxID=3241598 RepID=UPI003531B940
MENQQNKPLTLSDFNKASPHTYTINKEVVIFNAPTESQSITIKVPNDDLQEHLPKINNYLSWLTTCSSTLIQAYNKDPYYDDVVADDSWFQNIQVYKATIMLNQDGSISAIISGGDDQVLDHILDVELKNKEVTYIGYDG